MLKNESSTQKESHDTSSINIASRIPAQLYTRLKRWYLTYPLSYRQVAEMVNEQGLDIHHTNSFRWVQQSAPELDQRCPTGSQSPTEGFPPAALTHRPPERPTNDSWRVDETYIKIKGKDRYLYRAVDSTGQTLNFL